MPPPSPAPKEIWWCMLGNIPDPAQQPDPTTSPVVAHELGKTRPVIILGVYPNHEIATIVPITRGAENLPISQTVVQVPAGSWSGTPAEEGRALVHQIRGVSFERLDNKIGMLVNEQVLNDVHAGILLHLRIKLQKR